MLYAHRLLNYASNNNMPPPNAEKLLANEIAWLKDVRVSFSMRGMYCKMSELGNNEK